MTNANWMTELPEKLREMPLINLAIPGSHNSMTYGINGKSKIAGDATKSTRRMFCLCPCIVRRWAKTQEVTVTEQLNQGVRYFDLRVCLNGKNFFYAHGVYAMEVFEPLEEIKHFLQLHPKEVVILDFQHFYEFKPNHHMTLQNRLIQLFEKLLYTPNDGTLRNCTLKYCAENHKQVIIVYRRCALTLPNEFWPSNKMPTPSPDVSSVKQLKQFLEEAILSRTENEGYVSQVILTPNARYIVLRFYSTLKKTAKKVDEKMASWISEQVPGPFKKGQPTANIFITDFTNLNDAAFCNTIIELNQKIALNA